MYAITQNIHSRYVTYTFKIRYIYVTDLMYAITQNIHSRYVTYTLKIRYTYKISHT
jgi:hypothetical protein